MGKNWTGPLREPVGVRKTVYKHAVQKHRYQHGVTRRKTIIFEVTTVRNSNLTGIMKFAIGMHTLILKIVGKYSHPRQESNPQLQYVFYV
jgi:hypothetical protein